MVFDENMVRSDHIDLFIMARRSQIFNPKDNSVNRFKMSPYESRLSTFIYKLINIFMYMTHSVTC